MWSVLAFCQNEAALIPSWKKGGPSSFMIIFIGNRFFFFLTKKFLLCFCLMWTMLLFTISHLIVVKTCLKNFTFLIFSFLPENICFMQVLLNILSPTLTFCLMAVVYWLGALRFYCKTNVGHGQSETLGIGQCSAGAWEILGGGWLQSTLRQKDFWTGAYSMIF